MSLDVWFKDDIRNTLLALNETSRDTHALVVSLAGDSATATSYRSGYGDALRAVAIAFGIANPRLGDGYNGATFLAPGTDVIPSLAPRRASIDRGRFHP